jgi:hypothetical protein
LTLPAARRTLLLWRRGGGVAARGAGAAAGYAGDRDDRQWIAVPPGLLTRADEVIE